MSNRNAIDRPYPSLKTIVTPFLLISISFSLGSPSHAGSLDDEQTRLVNDIHAQIAKCYHLPNWVTKSIEHFPEVQIRIRPDGSLDSVPKITKPSLDPKIKSLEDAVIRAIKDCAPYAISPAYKQFSGKGLAFKLDTHFQN